jgi:T5orf172 domain/Domain of unknown function (DUF4113)
VEGYVYVMSNKAMPGLVNVGFTTGTPDERAAQLNGTHSPHPVVVEYSTHVSDARAVEREAHLRLRNHRDLFTPAPRRERLMAALDAVNDRFGRRTLRVGHVEGH